MPIKTASLILVTIRWRSWRVPPLLTLARGTTNCWLTIGGDTNHVHEIQESTNLLYWSPVMSFTLTNDPQTVSLSLPATGAKFWRVRAQ